MEECNELDKPWFTAIVIETDEQPAGFQAWTEGIKQDKYTIILPDGSTTHAKLFMDLQQRFDDYEYTRYLLNRFLELQ